MMLTRWIPLNITVSDPKSHSVGSGPSENISLRIEEATNVLIPVSLGRVRTIAADDIMATQINTDMVELNSTIQN